MTERKVTIAAFAAVGLVAMGAVLLGATGRKSRCGKIGPVGTQESDCPRSRTEDSDRSSYRDGPRDTGPRPGRIQHMGGGASDLFAVIPFWSHRLMVDRLRIAATEADRLESMREHRDRMRDLEALMGGYAKTGQGRVSDSLKATYYRLEADQLLAESGGQDTSQVQLPDLRKGVHSAEPQSAPPTIPR